MQISSPIPNSSHHSPILHPFMEITTNNSIHELPPSKRFDTDSSPCLPAKKRVYVPPLETAASDCLPAKKRVCVPLPDNATSVLVCLPAKKRVFAPPATAASVSVCLPAKKRVWAPFVPHSPSSKKLNAAYAAASGEGKDQESKKAGEAVDRKLAKEQESKKAGRAIDPKEPKDQESKKEVVEEEEEDDDGVLCAVCRSTDGDPSDPIVFCDGCDLMVHASCYGNPLIQSIPDGDWFCSLCSRKAAAARRKKKKVASANCCLCPVKGGAAKRTTDGRWAHIACALLVPEVFFRDPDGREGIDCSRVPGDRFVKECYICVSSRGCALECSEPKCGLGFHVSCGLDRGLCIEYREAKGGAIVAGFCRDHTKLWEKQQLTGKYKIVARGA